MRDRGGNLTLEAITLLNVAARTYPGLVSMYPLSQCAADMGREGLVTVVHGKKEGRHRLWDITVAEAGWPFVTDPEAAHEYRKRTALKRLGGQPDGPMFGRRYESF